MPQPPMKSNSPDDFQTPPEALEPLLPYIKEEWNIWEPACGKGNIVKELHRHGFKCLGSDINPQALFAHYDFSTVGEPLIEYDFICTNPPYSLKDEFLARCYALGKPFALLLPLTAFDSRVRRQLFAKHGVEVIFLPRRISFETPNADAGKKSSAWFTTCWFTWGLNIGRQLTFTDSKLPDILI